MQFPIIDAASVPEHRNSHQSGKTACWSGSDTLDQFQTNCKNNITKELLTSLEFSETSITYKYNCYGFRDEEFDRRSCGMAFGCSHTEGVGVPVEDAWPRVLSKLTNTWVWNFGVGASSLDTVFRLLDFWLPHFTPKFIAICVPSAGRVEIFNHGNPTTLVPQSDINNNMLENFYKLWASSKENMDIDRRKNLLAIEKLCNDRNIQLVALDCLELIVDANARDLIHTGAIGHREFAKKIKEKL
jgi:hypothetical protein